MVGVGRLGRRGAAAAFCQRLGKLLLRSLYAAKVVRLSCCCASVQLWRRNVSVVARCWLKLAARGPQSSAHNKNGIERGRMRDGAIDP